MSWEILWTPAALRDLRRLEHRTQERIREAVEQLASSGHGDVKRLRGRRGVFRLRVGNFRVFFTYDGAKRLLIVLRVFDRKDAY